MRIPGRWREEFALDHHTLSSTFLGDDEFGHPMFETTRSEIGDLLYRLKYRTDESVVHDIIDAAVELLSAWRPGIEVVVPVPASRTRSVQPVLVLGSAMAKRLGIPFASECVSKSHEVPELKNVHDFDERTRLLAGAHTVDRTHVQGRRVLLFDDLYRSGATMNAVAGALYDQGGVLDVFALTVTKTRSKT